MKVARVRSSQVTYISAEIVQVGEYKYTFETYPNLLTRYEAHAHSRARATNATAHKLARALACGRMVGRDIEHTGSEMHKPRGLLSPTGPLPKLSSYRN